MNAQLEEELLEEPGLVPAADRRYDSFSGTRKAAMLLISLGDQASAKIVSQLSEDEIQRVSKEVARIKSLSGGQVEGVLEEFYNLTLASAMFLGRRTERQRPPLNVGDPHVSFWAAPDHETNEGGAT